MESAEAKTPGEAPDRPAGNAAADHGKLSCPACGGALQPFSGSELLRCPCCGLCRRRPLDEHRNREALVRHYRTADPREQVARAKAPFFEKALDVLEEAFPARPRRLLDVGCGGGEFLQQASRRGWDPAGIDVLPEAVAAARCLLPRAQIHLGSLPEEVSIPSGLQAVTFWDVMDHLEDPAAYLRAAVRLLCPGGMVGIRTRNVAVQLLMRRVDDFLLALRRRPARRTFHVLHRVAFTPESLERLLERTGLEPIGIANSPLTVGDPYGLAPRFPWIRMLKTAAAPIADVVSAASGGKMLFSPSLLAWARKP